MHGFFFLSCQSFPVLSPFSLTSGFLVCMKTFKSVTYGVCMKSCHASWKSVADMYNADVY